MAMQVEQFVMAYGVEHDRLRALLPEGYTSLRPVLRINAEIRDGSRAYVELNTASEHDGKRGWLNIACWEDVPFSQDGKTTVFDPDFLTLRFTRVGIEGGCPAEKDNGGCFFPAQGKLRPPETITEHTEFCDCEFAWKFAPGDAHGVGLGKTLPAAPSEVKTVYPKQALTAESAAKIPCEQVLGTYAVRFSRA